MRRTQITIHNYTHYTHSTHKDGQFCPQCGAELAQEESADGLWLFCDCLACDCYASIEPLKREPGYFNKDDTKSYEQLELFIVAEK